MWKLSCIPRLQRLRDSIASQPRGRRWQALSSSFRGFCDHLRGTGVVTGGIIGTVRFHFDMWGGAVYGAVKMEEQGERGRVHISNATHALVKDNFECARAMGEGCEKQVDDSVRELGISGSFLVAFEKSRPAAQTVQDRESSLPRGGKPPRRSILNAPLGFTGGGDGTRRRTLTGAIGAVAAVQCTGLPERV